MTAFYTSLNGLKNAETDLRVISHNIANAETVGFKKSSAQFADIVTSGSASGLTDTAKRPSHGTPALILYGSNLGTTEDYARDLARTRRRPCPTPGRRCRRRG